MSSLLDSENLPTLFLGDIENDLFFPDEFKDNNLNDSYNESKKEIHSKPIKFILTKEKAPSIKLLQKKTISKLDSENNTNGGRWNKHERKLFAEAILKYGNDWKKIQNHIFSRDITQIRSHAQKFLMRLKEIIFRNKGLELSMSWMKAMNYLRSILNYEELKHLFFSVEQNDRNKSSKKKNKKRKIEEKENSEFFDTNNLNGQINARNINFFFEDEKDSCKYNINNKTIIQEEDEEQILQKYIDCFNSPSGNITLNTSFEEDEENEKDISYNFISDI